MFETTTQTMSWSSCETLEGTHVQFYIALLEDGHPMAICMICLLV